MNWKIVNVLGSATIVWVAVWASAAGVAGSKPPVAADKAGVKPPAVADEDDRVQFAVHIFVSNDQHVSPLSAELQFVKDTEATVLGVDAQGGLLLEAPREIVRRESAHIARIHSLSTSEQATLDPVNSLLVSYEPGKRPDMRAIDRAGWILSPKGTFERGNFLAVSPKKEISGQALEALAAIPGVTQCSIDKPIRRLPGIPRPTQASSGCAACHPQRNPPADAGAPSIRQLSDWRASNDELASGQWALLNINAAVAWSRQKSSDVIVAVIDTGVDFEHEDLKDNMWVNAGETGIDEDGMDRRFNGKDDDGNGYVDDVHGYDFVNDDGQPWDDQGHGTHSAGIIGAMGDNARGSVGVVWKTRLMALKALDIRGDGSVAHAIKAVYYAIDNGAKVINCSWGTLGFNPQMLDAIEAARKAGVLVITAAGNTSTNNDKPTAAVYPASYESENVIAVASLSPEGRLSHFSNYGVARVHIAAPGEQILSTFPRNHYKALSGTSQAAPFVAGAVALSWGSPEYASYDWKQIKQLLLTNARKVNELKYGPRTVASHGTLDLAFLGRGGDAVPVAPSSEGDLSPLIVRSVQLDGDFTLMANETDISSIALDLPQDCEIQVLTNGRATGPKEGRCLVGITDSINGELWPDSIKSLVLGREGDGVRVTSACVHKLSKGTHTLYWAVRFTPAQNSSEVAGMRVERGATMTVVAYPARPAPAKPLQQAEDGGTARQKLRTTSVSE